MTHAANSPYYAQLDTALAEVLRGQVSPWPGDLNLVPLDTLWNQIAGHGVAALLVDTPPLWESWPDGIVQKIREEARLQAVWEMSHISAVSPIFGTAHQRGITSLVMKGSALAYSLYRDPAHRRRGDTDLLVRPEDVNAMRCILRDCGFSKPVHTGLLQETWTRVCSSGFVHDIDLHWAVSSSPAVAAAFPLGRLFTKPAPLPKLDPNALAPPIVQQLLQACLNPLSHQLVGMAEPNQAAAAGKRLIWTYDCHLIAGALHDDQWDELKEHAVTLKVAGMLGRGLQLAKDQLRTRLPLGFLDDLARHAADDIVLRYFTIMSPRSRFDADLAASKGLAEKTRVIWAHVMATPDLLRAQYPLSDKQPIWLLRIRRIARQFKPGDKARSQ